MPAANIINCISVTACHIITISVPVFLLSRPPPHNNSWLPSLTVNVSNMHRVIHKVMQEMGPHGGLFSAFVPINLTNNIRFWPAALNTLQR